MDNRSPDVTNSYHGHATVLRLSALSNKVFSVLSYVLLNGVKPMYARCSVTSDKKNVEQKKMK